MSKTTATQSNSKDAKRFRFKRIAPARIKRLIRAFEQMQKVASPRTYTYTAVEARQIVEKAKALAAELEAAFFPKLTEPEQFAIRFSEESEGDQLSIGP